MKVINKKAEEIIQPTLTVAIKFSYAYQILIAEKKAAPGTKMLFLDL